MASETVRTFFKFLTFLQNPKTWLFTFFELLHNAALLSNAAADYNGPHIGWRQPGFATSNIVSRVEATDRRRAAGGMTSPRKHGFRQSPRSSVMMPLFSNYYR